MEVHIHFIERLVEQNSVELVIILISSVETAKVDISTMGKQDD